MTVDTSINVQGIIELALVITGVIVFYFRESGSLTNRISVAENNIRTQEETCIHCKSELIGRIESVENGFEKKIDKVSTEIIEMRKEMNNQFQVLNQNIINIIKGT